MSVARALRDAIREVRHRYGYREPAWNDVCDTLTQACVDALLDEVSDTEAA